MSINVNPSRPATATLNTVDLIVIKESKLLLSHSNNKKAWYLPGGKIAPEETPVQSLIREIEEELQVKLSETELKPCFHISARAFGEKQPLKMEQDCFLGPLNNNYRASCEIGDIHFFSPEEYLPQQPIVPGVIIAFEQLMVSGVISESRA